MPTIVFFPTDSAEGKIAFSVHLQGDQRTTLSTGDVVVYDQLLTNLGNDYNKNNGLFTTRIPGTYFFTLYLMTTDDYSHLGIYVNDDLQCTAFGEPHHGVATCSIIRELSRGDVVSVKVFRDGASLHGDRGGWKYQNGFIGLLYKAT